MISFFVQDNFTSNSPEFPAGMLRWSMSSEYCVCIPEFFSLNWKNDPCISDNVISCTNEVYAAKGCPIGIDFFRFPAGEFRLDFAHCNLRCVPCWAKQCPHEDHFNCYRDGYGYKESFTAEEIVERMICRSVRINEYVKGNRTFQIRITGGEPLLSKERWNHLVEMLNTLDRKLDSKQSDYSGPLDNRLRDYGRHGQRKRKRVVAQSNGILLGNTIPVDDFMDVVKSLRNLAILFHLSVKGSNADEFGLLTKGNEKLFTHQVELINSLKEARKFAGNFDFQIVFGFFHSREYILWNPHENKPMLIEPELSFFDLVKRNWMRTFVEPLDFRPRMVEKARTIQRCLKEDIVRRKSDVSKNVLSRLEPLPCSGKKVGIDRTFWNQLVGSDSSS